MKRCPECGREYEDEHGFCGSCGVPLEKVSEPCMTCPKCGAQYAMEHAFCGECGSELKPGTLA